MRYLLALCCVALVLATSAIGEEKPQAIAGIGPTGPAVKVQTGFKFTEGPTPDAEGNVYFTDIPNNKIHKVDPEGKLSTVLENSEGCNGLKMDPRGRLVSCQGKAGKIVAVAIKTGKVEVLADSYEGKRFNAPNDLTIDRQGGIYFTDPAFGKDRPQGKEGVYYLAPGGKVTRLIDDQPRPNGVLLSPDEKTLYVLKTSDKAPLLAYPIEKPGVIGAGKPLGKVERPGDGMTVDTRGNLYLTQPSASSILVMSPEGKTLGSIKVPEGPANCCFGGKDMKTLYVTARTSLYSFPMEATGHRFVGVRPAEK